MGAPGAAVLAAALRANTSLRELSCKGNELGDEGVKALCDALRERSARERPAQQPRLIGAAARRRSSSAATHQPFLPAAHTSLAWGKPCTRGGNTWRRPVAPWHAAITSVDFGNNNLGAEGAAALANLLREGSKSVEEVNIYMNDVGDSGAFKASLA